MTVSNQLSVVVWHTHQLFLILHLKDQVQEELSRVVGSRQVLVADRKSLPYSNAVIHEVQRVISVVPKTAHCTSRDVIFQGFFIKKVKQLLSAASALLSFQVFLVVDGESLFFGGGKSEIDVL